MKLKVCGMKYNDNMNQVATLQPDYLGFIFHEKSSRFFEGNIPEVSKNIKKVGVFVDASLDYVLEKVQTHNLQTIQLHGQETPEYCKELQALCRSAFDAESIIENEILNQAKYDKKIEIIKVFSIKDTFDFSVLQPYENVCDYYLFDPKGKLPGGNGYTFNWDVLKEYPSTKPFFLSGGIGLQELENITSFLNTEPARYCYALDVNSKFEIEPGLKNIEKLKKFINQLSFRT